MEKSKPGPFSNTVVSSSIFFFFAVCFVALIHVEIELYAHRQMLRILTQQKEGYLERRQTVRAESSVITPSLHGDSGKGEWLFYS